MKTVKIIFLLVIAGTLAACESTSTKVMNEISASGAAPLSADEIRSTLYGNSLYLKSKTSKGNPMQYTGFYQDGTISGRSWGAGWDELDTATTNINDNDEFCRSWAKWKDGKKACYKVYRLSEEVLAFEFVSGAGSTDTVTIKPGNPYEL